MIKQHHRTGLLLIVVLCLTSLGRTQASPSGQVTLADPASLSSAYPVEGWVTGSIYAPDSAGSHVSIAFDPDHEQAAWVSFYNASDGGLWAAHYIGPLEGDCGSDSAWKCMQVDQVDGESKGLYSSIDVHPDTNPNPLLTNWKVGISYYDETHRALKYASYHCPVGDVCEWTPQTLQDSSDPDRDIGQYTSMKFDSTGIAHIIYYDHNGDTAIELLGHAYYLGGTSGNCGDNDWQCDRITWDNAPKRYASLDIDWQDQLYVSFYNEEFGRLVYANSFDVSNCGDAGWHCETLDDPAGVDVGMFSSITAPQSAQEPVRVAYYDATNGNLKYAYLRDDTNGNCGINDAWQCESIDSMGAGLTWASISMAVDSGGAPVIAYTRSSGIPAALSLGVAEPAPGQPYANCGAGGWWCGTLDSGNSFFDVGRYASLRIKPDGRAMAAYSSLAKLGADYTLKFAYQPLLVFLPLGYK
jgi:hypothetical protein